MGLHSSVGRANVSCPQLNSKNNGLLGLLFKSILWCPICFLTFFATDGKDEMDRNLKKLGQPFQVLMLSQQKITKTLLWVALFDTIH